ncbi:hypothetical protein IJG72_06510 [bacterium]|nr:hypothetical protein [bacterium]
MTIEPYNYNDEPSGRTDTLIRALEKIERLENCLEVAESLIKELAFGYQSRKQYNKLISAARMYFEEKPKIEMIKELEK